MLILVGPSASGKTQIAQMLIKEYGLRKLVTYTTRAMRVGEVNDKDYHFISKVEFSQKINNNFFFEYVSYNGNFYGTSFEDITSDKVVILEPNGIKTYIERLREKVMVIFLKCDKAVLEQRMHMRGDNEKSIRDRLKLDDKVFTKDIIDLCDFVVDTSKDDLEGYTKEVYELYQSRL